MLTHLQQRLGAVLRSGGQERCLGAVLAAGRWNTVLQVRATNRPHSCYSAHLAGIAAGRSGAGQLGSGGKEQALPGLRLHQPHYPRQPTGGLSFQRLRLTVGFAHCFAQHAVGRRRQGPHCVPERQGRAYNA